MNENSETFLILILAALIFGFFIGWLLTRFRARAKFISTEAKFEAQTERISELNATIEKLNAQFETLRIESQNKINESTRFESGLLNANRRVEELQNELKGLHTKNENSEREYTATRELYAGLKAKHDKQLLETIEITNERSRLKDQVENYRVQENELNKKIAEFTAKHDEAVRALTEQKLFVENSQKTLKDSFNALSAAALDQNNQSFLDLAKTALESHVTEAKGDLEKRQQAIDGMVKPLGDSLSKMDEKINLLENKREGAYGNITALLDQVKTVNMSLDKETRNLVTALKTSHTRGKYGEIALRRLVEFAGMTDQCDFVEQESTDTENGRLRPDMIIKLPVSRQVVVDSKVPLNAYLKIFETDDHDQQKLLIAQHVTAVKTHLRQLSAKAYWEQFPEAPDFVVLFMQIESSFGAALQAWPELIEEALNNRIIVATPTTLITILRTIGYSWNQIKTMENIEEIRDAAVELYERSTVLMGHMASIGNGLTSTVTHYNKAVGSLEASFLPQGRKIQSLSQAYVKKELKEPEPVELSVRPIISIGPISSETEGGKK
jgi:DNA recombination protein RmuC